MIKSAASKIFFFRHLPKKVLILLVLTIFGAGWFFYSNTQAQKPKIETSKVNRGDIRSTISASGVLTGKNNANLKFRTAGKLANMNIKSGDQVTKGQVVARLDTQQLSIELQQARNSLRDKQAIAEKILDDVKDSSKDETFDERQKRTTAEAARDNAYDAVKEAERAFGEVVLISPIDGIVTTADFVAGQNVLVTDTIATIIDDSEIYFDAEVDESDITKVSLNQKTEISLNSYPNKKFTGIIAETNPITKTTSSGATVVIVRINLGNPGIKFIANINGQAEIITEEKFNVLTVPQDAISSDNVVYVQLGNTYQSTKIETGLSSGTDIEVKNGLTEDQVVVTNPSEIKR